MILFALEVMMRAGVMENSISWTEWNNRMNTFIEQLERDNG